MRLAEPALPIKSLGLEQLTCSPEQRFLLGTFGPENVHKRSTDAGMEIRNLLGQSTETRTGNAFSASNDHPAHDILLSARRGCDLGGRYGKDLAPRFD